MLPSKSLRELFRFGIVGLVNTGFSYAIYAGLLHMGVKYAIANGAAIVLGVLFSFKTQGTLVFRNAEHPRLFRFVLAWSLIYAVNLLLIARFLRLGFDSYASGALAIPFVTILSYFAQKFFVFRAAPSTAAE